MQRFQFYAHRTIAKILILFYFKVFNRCEWNELCNTASGDKIGKVD